VSHFRSEIGEQPAVAARLLGDAAALEPIAAAIKRAQPIAIMLAARGSSDHAALYAKYLFQARNRIPVALAAPSLFTHYAAPPRLERFCVIGISQSGASPDVSAVLEEARHQGLVTVALTNEAGSPLAAAADFAVALQAGAEQSVPASKTYTASLLAIALLSEALDPAPDFLKALQHVPEAMRVALASEDQAERMGNSIAGENLVVLGRGFNLATAEELALKLTETSYVMARAWSAADFLHGPIAIAEDRFPLIMVESPGPTQTDSRQLAARLHHSGCQVRQLADGTDPLPDAASAILFNSGLPEALTPLSLAVAAQLLAYHLALARGRDPDRPRSLKKVTQTW
jgi:glucosamine--fructose-6-phosphate aminotransferase (isomerizing)